MNYKLTKTISIVSSLLTTLTISNFAQAEKTNKEEFQFTKTYIKKDIESITPEPAAIKWKDITISNDKTFACASFAAKNKYGAYDGFVNVLYQYGNGSISRQVWPDCYKDLNYTNYAQSPEGRIQIEKNEKAKKENERLTEEQLANEQKESQLRMERARKQEEEDTAKYLAESDKRNKEREEEYARDDAKLQEDIAKSKAESDKYNKEFEEKSARDDAEQQKAIAKSKAVGLIPKKLFDLLPK